MMLDQLCSEVTTYPVFSSDLRLLVGHSDSWHASIYLWNPRTDFSLENTTITRLPLTFPFCDNSIFPTCLKFFIFTTSTLHFWNFFRAFPRNAAMPRKRSIVNKVWRFSGANELYPILKDKNLIYDRFSEKVWKVEMKIFPPTFATVANF